MRPSTAIKKFNRGASEIMIRRLNYIERGQISFYHIYDPFQTEIFRSLFYTADQHKVMFPIDIDFHDKPLYEAVRFSLVVAKKLDQLLHGEILWKFSGRGLHGITILDARDNPHYEDCLKRWTNVQIMRQFGENLSKKVFGMDTSIYKPRSLIRSLGSINTKTYLFSIPINLDWSVKKILEKAQIPEIDDWEIPHYTRKIDISGIRDAPQIVYEKRFKMTPQSISVREFPPCMQTILQLPEIHFWQRVPLIAYLRDTGRTVEEIYEMIGRIWGKEKEEHVQKGKEVERFFETGYPTPSCVYMREHGFCPGFCGRYHPLHQLEVDENDKGIE